MKSISQSEFLECIAPHKGILLKVSKTYMDNLDDQADLQQEILLQLWKAYPSFKGNSAFSTWMYRVSINTAITYFKVSKKKRIHIALDDDSQIIQEEDNPLKNEQLSHFYNAVQQLNSVEKALILYSVEGYAQKEIAQQLGLSEVNTRVKIKRTKEKLKSIIKKQGYEF